MTKTLQTEGFVFYLSFFLSCFFGVVSTTGEFRRPSTKTTSPSPNVVTSLSTLLPTGGHRHESSSLRRQSLVLCLKVKSILYLEKRVVPRVFDGLRRGPRIRVKEPEPLSINMERYTTLTGFKRK